jgi:Domain of unknown function (DUF4124)
MSYFRIFLLLSIFCFGSAAADIWKWVDAEGKTHFVDTSTSIFTWVEDGRVFYSDTPDHEDAIAVQLVWVSKGTIDDKESAANSSDGYAFPGETPDERAEREDAEAYYCKRATEIYDSYKNAPRLYRTNDAGEREYLSEESAKVTLTETKTKMDELCS